MLDWTLQVLVLFVVGGHGWKKASGWLSRYNEGRVWREDDSDQGQSGACSDGRLELNRESPLTKVASLSSLCWGEYEEDEGGKHGGWMLLVVKYNRSHLGLGLVRGRGADSRGVPRFDAFCYGGSCPVFRGPPVVRSPFRDSVTG